MDADFAKLIAQLRAGDEAAAEELVRSFESAVRVAIRTRLLDASLRRQFDSMDICQSVLASFFVRIASGQFDLQHPAQLVALLKKIAHNKLAQHARHSIQPRRDVHRVSQATDVCLGVASMAAGPVRTAIGRELLQQVWKQMDDELRQIASYRLDGKSWVEIATALGGSSEARRKQYQRGIDRIIRLLGIEEDDRLCAQ